MSLPYKWELPGGKLEPGEDAANCLYRETYEELRLHVTIIDELPHVDRFFREKHYRMLPYTCTIIGGQLEVIEHAQAVWQPIDRIFELDWAPAEKLVLEAWLAAIGRRVAAVMR